MSLTTEVKKLALESGADLVGIASIDRFDNAPANLHPRTIFGHTASVIALGCRHLRGSLKAIEEGNYWQAYNCDSYQYINEVLAPNMLRKLAIFLEDQGYTSVPIHNPFSSHQGRPVQPGGTRPDGLISLRVVGCAAGLGELGLSKLFLTPQFGPRQRMFALLTDAVLDADPLLPEGSVCDNCGQCAKACPGDAIPLERSVEFKIGDRVFSHAPLDCGKCHVPHIGWVPKYSPFLKKDSSPDNPPEYYKWLDTRFRHHTLCGGRGCIRMCMDHLEKTGRIQKRYMTPMVEGQQWTIEDPLE